MDKLTTLRAQWLAAQPLSQRKQYLLDKLFLVDYHYNTNHLEGNTLTYGQTELLLLLGKVSGESPLKDFVDMSASLVSMKMLEEEILRKAPLTQTFIRQLHKTLLREDYIQYHSLPDSTSTSYTIHAGAYKSRSNSVITLTGERFDYASPEETPALMTDLVDWINDAIETHRLAPTDLAALFHYRYIRIHPFEDGNGRMARLLTNYILARFDWPMVVVRNKNKREYLEALHATDIEIGPSATDGAQASLQQIRTFRKFFKKLVANDLKFRLDFARESAPNVWWFDGEKIAFRSHTSSTLLLAMQEEPDISIRELAQISGISTTAVQKQLRNMIRRGFLLRHNSQWRVLATSAI